MSPHLTILCYHRVLPEGTRHSSGRCYFMRGSAVSEKNFSSQLEAIGTRYSFVSQAEVLAWYEGSRSIKQPACWVTFDDGYRDAFEIATPTLRRLGVPATMFLSPSVVENPGTWLPVDIWYETLSRATRWSGVLALDGHASWRFDLSRDFGRLVDGPEKRAYIEAPHRIQQLMVACLASSVESAPSSPCNLYLDRVHLTALAELDWSFGGHGYSHALLTNLDEAGLDAEVRLPLEFLSKLGHLPAAFSYPNGNYDQRVIEAIRAAGWSAALTIDQRPAMRSDDRFSLGRFIPPDDPSWFPFTGE